MAMWEPEYEQELAARFADYDEAALIERFQRYNDRTRGTREYGSGDELVRRHQRELAGLAWGLVRGPRTELRDELVAVGASTLQHYCLVAYHPGLGLPLWTAARNTVRWAMIDSLARRLGLTTTARECYARVHRLRQRLASGERAPTAEEVAHASASTTERLAALLARYPVPRDLTAALGEELQVSAASVEALIRGAADRRPETIADAIRTKWQISAQHVAEVLNAWQPRTESEWSRPDDETEGSVIGRLADPDADEAFAEVEAQASIRARLQETLTRVRAILIPVARSEKFLSWMLADSGDFGGADQRTYGKFVEQIVTPQPDHPFVLHWAARCNNEQLAEYVPTPWSAVRDLFHRTPPPPPAPPLLNASNLKQFVLYQRKALRRARNNGL